MKKILWWEPLLDSSDSRAASKAIKMNYPNEGLFTKKLEKKLKIEKKKEQIKIINYIKLFFNKYA